jgi:hypothetical protein
VEPQSQQYLKNPKRVAAGRINRRKRRGLTAEGLERLRQTALSNQPWKLSSGPRTPQGRFQSRLNGKRRQHDPLMSIREAKAAVKDVKAFLAGLAELGD